MKKINSIISLSMQKSNDLPIVFSGVVIEGRKLGRKLGYPTANLVSQEGILPDIPHGVYAGWASIDGKRYLSIMSFGKAETVKAAHVCFEVHLLDYEGDLYGRELKVTIALFLRHMVKFNSVEQLTEAMREDERRARELLKEQ